MVSIKIFILGIVVYFSKDLFFNIGAYWFDELNNRNNFEDRVDILRKNFWKSFLLVLFVILSLVTYLALSDRIIVDEQLNLRIVGIIIALTASLGRGGWAIQSFKNKTIVERIDRGMFVLSQLGATIILIFTLTM